MTISHENFSNNSEEMIPVIVRDDDKPLMMPANILSLALERGWLKGKEQIDKGGSLTHNNVPD